MKPLELAVQNNGHRINTLKHMAYPNIIKVNLANIFQEVGKIQFKKSNKSPS